MHSVEHVTWAFFVSKCFPWRIKAENWLKYFSVPASGNNNPARLSCYSGLGCLFSLSKHVRINLPLISVCFHVFPSLLLLCYSRTCPSACLAICTFHGFSEQRDQGSSKRSHSPNVQNIYFYPHSLVPMQTHFSCPLFSNRSFILNLPLFYTP